MEETYHGRIAILLNPDANIGGATLQLIRNLWDRHTNTAFRQERRLLALAKRYSYSRLEAACRQVLSQNQHVTVDAVISILTQGLDRPLPSDRLLTGFRSSNLESQLPREKRSL